MAAIVSIAAKIGCSAHRLNTWVKKAEVDSGRRAGIPTEMAEKMKALERENRELHQGEADQQTVRWTVSPPNEIVRKGEPLSAIGPRTMASVYRAMAEHDRRST